MNLRSTLPFHTNATYASPHEYVLSIYSNSIQIFHAFLYITWKEKYFVYFATFQLFSHFSSFSFFSFLKNNKIKKLFFFVTYEMKNWIESDTRAAICLLLFLFYNFLLLLGVCRCGLRGWNSLGVWKLHTPFEIFYTPF